MQTSEFTVSIMISAEYRCILGSIRGECGKSIYLHGDVPVCKVLKRLAQRLRMMAGQVDVNVNVARLE
jgi:hypothetical protein